MNLLERNEPRPCGSEKESKRYGQAGTGVTHSSGTAIAALVASANKRLSQGELNPAEDICRSILQAQPDQPEAMHCLGLIEFRRGHLEAAVVMMGRAVRLDPGNAAYHCNLGCVLMNLGKHREAGIMLQRSVSLSPGSAEARMNLGITLIALGRASDAVGELERAVAIKAESPEAHFNLGNALAQLSRWGEAIRAYKRATSLRPLYSEAHANLGIALRASGRKREGVLAYKKSIEIEPKRPEVFVNLAIAQAEDNENAQALETCAEGISRFPDWPELHFNRGNAYQLLGDLDAAIGSYQEAIKIRPEYAEAYNNLGTAVQAKGEMTAAIEAYETALKLNPRYLGAFSNLIYIHAFTRRMHPRDQWQLASQWELAALSDEERAAVRNQTFANPPRHNRKLRFGIVSAELGRHAVAEFLLPVLERMDKNRFELVLYPTVDRTDGHAELFRSLADEYYSLSTASDADSAAKIRADRIDVLLDTTGHTNGCRLGIFARRAAPVQCTWIGFWASTGLSEMDYYFTYSSFPKEYDSHYRETLWRLGHSADVYRGDTSLPESSWEPASDGTIWLGSYNKYSKISEECIALWSKAMHRLPNSKLLLEDRTPFDHQMHGRILDGFREFGIAAERIEFSPHKPGWESHMQLYNRLDIALDTVPFNSGTTAYDALWMGVPLVTLEGDWGGGRMASTVLRSLGRDEWIARNSDEFAAIVGTLAGNVELRRKIRKTQRAMMSQGALCDAEQVARQLEIALEGMYDRWVAGQHRRA